MFAGLATRRAASRASAAVDLTLGSGIESGSGAEICMAEPVRARRLTEQEGQRLTALVRRGRANPIRVRRATIILASSSGTPVSAIARLVAADEDTCPRRHPRLQRAGAVRAGP